MISKQEILQDAGFKQMPQRLMWIDPNRRQAFSEITISDHGEDWLKSWLTQAVPDTEFWFHFRSVTDETRKDCDEILARLRLRTLTPVIHSSVQHNTPEG